MSQQEINETIDRYKIIALLGQGGMGEVFKAHDMTLRRDVAIKVMHTQYAHQPNFQERFLQEARTAARLNQPGIVQVHDFGQYKGRLYIVMEFIPGQNLGQILRDFHASGRWMTLSEAIGLIRQVALSLDYAHNQGVLHRDIKPDNIMLKPEPSDGLPFRPVITDLGLAKLTEGGVMTQEGTSMGTPAYMSPEQALGKPTDPRSDVYSLGVLLYELSTGQQPFQPNNLPEAIHFHTQVPPPPPRSVRPDLPESLEKIILKALQKEPAGRYSTALDLAKALEGALPAATQIAQQESPLVKAVSLVTLTQKEPVEPRGPSLIRDFEREFGSAAALRQDVIQIMSLAETSRSFEVIRDSLVIGRAPEGDISLNDGKVSRQHARLTRQGSQYQIQDLNSTNGTYLDGVKLLPGIPVAWESGKVAQVGDHWLRLVRAQYTPRQVEQRAAAVAPSGTQVGGPPVPAAASQAQVDISIDTPQMYVDPGGSVSTGITLLNQGQIVDHFRLRIIGGKPSWASFDRSIVRLLPGQEEHITITLKPPREPSSRAGQYPIQLEVTSQTAGIAGRAVLTLTISPFTQFTSEMHPEVFAAGKISRITVTNQGNQPEVFTVRWEDPAAELVFRPPRVQLQIPEGQSAATEFRAFTRDTHWFGSDRLYPFNASVSSPDGVANRHSGEFTSRARFSVLGILGLFMACIFLAVIGALAARFMILPIILTTPTPTQIAILPAKATLTSPSPATPINMVQPTSVATPPPVSATYTPVIVKWAGSWQTNFAVIKITQDGGNISGSYTWYGSDLVLQIQGVVDGNTLSGNIIVNGKKGNTFNFQMDPDGNSFEGSWGKPGQYQWCGVRSGTLKPGCGFSGHWNTASDTGAASQPYADIQQNGDMVKGTFFNGTSQGILSGKLGTSGKDPHYTLSGKYTIDGYTNDFIWVLVNFNSLQFQGTQVDKDGEHPWCGWRNDSSQPDPCANKK